MTVQTNDGAIQWESWPSEAQLQVMATLRRSHFDSSAVQAICDLVVETKVAVLEPLHRFSTLPVAGYDALGAFHKFASCLLSIEAKFAANDILFCLRDSKTVDVQELLIQYASLFAEASHPRYQFLPAATYMISSAAFDWIKARWIKCISLEDIGYAIGVLHALDRPTLIRSLCEYLLFYQEISLGPFVYSKGDVATHPVKGSIDIIRGLIEISNEDTKVTADEIDCIYTLITCDDFEIPHQSDAMNFFGPVQEILYQIVLRMVRRWQDQRVFLSNVIRKFASCPTYIAAIDLALCAIVDNGVPISFDELSSEAIFVERSDILKLINQGYWPVIATALCSDPMIMQELDRSASAATEAIRYFIVHGSIRRSSPCADILKENPFACCSCSLTLVSAILSLRSFIAGFQSDSYLEVCRMLAARIPQWVSLLKTDPKFQQIFDRDHLSEFIHCLDQLGAEPEFSLLPWSVRSTFLHQIEQLRSVISSCPRSLTLKLQNVKLPTVLIAGLIASSSFSVLRDYCSELIDFIATGNEKFVSLLPSSFWRQVLMAFAKIERQKTHEVTDIWLDFFLQKIAINHTMDTEIGEIDDVIQMTSLTFDTLPIADACQALYNCAKICGDAFMVLESLDDKVLLHYAEFAPSSLSSLISSYLDVECCWEWSAQIFGLKCARVIATLLSAAPKHFVRLISCLTAPTSLACLASGLAYQLIRYPDGYCRIMKTLWDGLLSVFGLYGDVQPSFSALINAMKCSDPDLSQLPAVLIIVGNRSYNHVGALYNLNSKPVDWLLQRAEVNPQSEQLILDTLGPSMHKRNWLDEFRSNRRLVQYDSSAIAFLLHDDSACELIDILPELLVDREEFVREFAEDMVVLISSSTSLLLPVFWKAAKVVVTVLDDSALVRCLCEMLDAKNFVNLEELLNVIRVISDRTSDVLVDALIRISTCDQLELRFPCTVLEILAVCASSGVGIDSLNCGFARHADYFFRNHPLSQYACQVLVAMQRSRAAPIALRAALSSCSTSSTLLRLSYLSEYNTNV